MSDSLRPHELQHARPPCPSSTPGVHWDSCPSSQWCHPAISSSVIPFSSCPQSLPASVFSNESTLRMRWPKYWSFSVSIIPSKEHPGLISFRMDWLDLLAAQGTLKSLLQLGVGLPFYELRHWLFSNLITYLTSCSSHLCPCFSSPSDCEPLEGESHKHLCILSSWASPVAQW